MPVPRCRRRGLRTSPCRPPHRGRCHEQPLSEEQREWPGREEVAALIGCGDRLVQGPPGQLEVALRLGEALGAQGELLGEVQRDAGRAAQGDGVGAEVPPGTCGDTGLLMELAAGALLRCLPGLLAAAGEKDELAAVIGRERATPRQGAEGEASFRGKPGAGWEAARGESRLPSSPRQLHMVGTRLRRTARPLAALAPPPEACVGARRRSAAGRVEGRSAGRRGAGIDGGRESLTPLTTCFSRW